MPLMRQLQRLSPAQALVFYYGLAIALGAKTVSTKDFYSGATAAINADACTACGACAQVCRYDAIIESEPAYSIDSLACEGCNACVLECPEEAISLKESKAGVVMESRVDFGRLVHAELGIAQDNSGKLVAEVRDQARQLGEQVDADFVLVDGPPGIGCPVHAAMGRIERLLAVTEPTPSGAHDLTRLLDLAHHFGIQATVVINKWDLAPELATQIETSCQERGVPVLGRIPFDKAIPRMLARGHLPLEAPASAETQQAIRDIWQRFSAPG